MHQLLLAAHLFYVTFYISPLPPVYFFLRHLILELEQADDKGAQDKGQQG